MIRKFFYWPLLLVLLNGLVSLVIAQNPIQVTHETKDLREMTFAWSPDGTQFAYIAWCDNEVKLYRINLDGSNKTLLADSVETSYGCPVDWKGSYIVFKAKSKTGTYPYNFLLRRIKPDGTDEKNIIGPYWYGDYVLRPGGNWLLFREAPAGWWVARRIDITGANAKTVSHSSLVQGIGWLGKSHILYTRGDNYNQPCKLYKVDFDGGNLATLTPNNLPNNIQFAASPDSSKILYCDGFPDSWDIWVMNANGSNKTRLTSDPAHELLSWPLQNVWMPDGQSFFFFSYKIGKGNIFKMNVNGTGLKQITFGDSISYMPNVSPDGKKLAFLSRRSGVTDIWYIDFEKVHVAIHDTSGKPNTYIDIPIYVSDVTDKNIKSFGLTVETNPAILIPQAVITTGTLSQAWGAATYNIVGGKIKIGHAGTTALAGSGKLIYLRYQVAPNAIHNSVADLIISDFIFNDGQPEVIITNGKFTVIAKYNISGTIRYYSNSIPVPAVEVKLDGNQKTTGNTGEFQFLDVIQGNYTLRPKKMGSSVHAVGPYDAALILMSVVQALTLTPYQKIAGDVSGNGQVTALDASYVLQYYVGLIPKFPVNKDWTFVPLSFPINQNNWPTAPDSIRYEPLNADKVNQDFVGIVYGDVSGNWQVPPGEYLARADQADKIIIGQFEARSDGRIIMPIEIRAASDLFAWGIAVQYSQDQLRFISAEPVTTTKSSALFSSHEQNGMIKMAMASAQAIADNSCKIRFIFEPIADRKVLAVTPITIQQFSVNGNDYEIKNLPQSQLDNFSVPQNYGLDQNYPNPFNA
ncbi:MAG: DUF5050 domain-containing protein, partial [candidate division KSB1 bacterium]|nr:DUF5050 domain-containing protein [candidate division KSB1 bacterium]